MTTRNSRAAVARIPDAPPLGLVLYDAGGHSGQVLADCARELQSLGYRVAGIVENMREREARWACDMYLEDLVTGAEVCISADRGKDAKGCRLDYEALAQATVWAEAALATKPQLLVLNKLGKEEVSGRGFFPVIAEALLQDIPVLVAVSALNLPAAREITDDLGVVMDSDGGLILEWCRAAIGARGPIPLGVP